MTDAALQYLALNGLLLDPSKNDDLCRRSGGPDKLPSGPRELEAARAEAAKAHARGILVLTPADDGFPATLSELGSATPRGIPPAIYIQGDPRALDLPSVALVGSRRSTPYGQEVAAALARDLARRGVAVVSGLARGIDSAAHRGALQGGGVTIAVLGSGILVPYPRENAPLQARIAREGLVVSEFPLEAPPLPRNFPRRNRIIAALSDVVVVVEATETSGSRHTADAAASLDRVVMAVPGPITAPTSRGCNALVRDGAAVATSVDDIITALARARRFAGRSDAPFLRPAPSPESTAPRGPLWDLLSVEAPRHVEEIALAARKSLPEVLAGLEELVLAGHARKLPGQLYQRALQRTCT